MAPEFAALENAFPRFLVTLDAVSHASFITGFCALGEVARLDSLAYQQDVLGVVEHVSTEAPHRAGFFITGKRSAIGRLLTVISIEFHRSE